jgi:glycosyltransferase involved in cell wall biosynthesis
MKTGKPIIKPEKLRVAIVFDCLFPIQTGGAERVYGRMAEIFQQMGHSVDYITRNFSDSDTQKTFHIEGIWAGELYNNQGNRIPKNAFLFSSSVFKYLSKNRTKYDLVFVSSTPVLNLLAASIALFRTRTTLIADWLEVWTLEQWKTYSGFLLGNLAFFLQTIAIKTGKIITVNSDFTARRFRKYRTNVPLVKLDLIDLVEQDPLNVEKSFQQIRNILFVGRHIKDKQIELLIQAMDHPALQSENLSLQIVGSGQETSNLQALTKNLRFPEKVQFLGKVSDEKLALLMQQATLLVNPSKREGFGLVVAEAAQWGTPSVVINEPDNAAKELIDPGVNGFIAEESTTESLALAIKEALDSGSDLRVSTRNWFVQKSKLGGLTSSLNEILDLVKVVQ